jgi:hypothetical protein
MPQPTVLTITLDDNAEISVQGPIGNKLICYSMLELARDAIKDHHDRARRVMDPPRIAIVGAMPGETLP